MLKLLIIAPLVWLIISAIMFVFSMGTCSPLQGAPHRKMYWKWSILLTIYICMPVVGWIAGFIHIYLALGRKK